MRTDKSIGVFLYRIEVVRMILHRTCPASWNIETNVGWLAGKEG